MLLIAAMLLAAPGNGSRSEIRLQIVQIDQNLRNEVAIELRHARSRMPYRVARKLPLS